MNFMKYSTEADARYKYINPAIKKSGWSDDQVFTEYEFTAGKFIVRGSTVKREKAKRADYILTHGDIPLAIIEAKSTQHSVDNGLQQCMEYAEILNVPFAYSTNGKGFIEYDFFTGFIRELSMDEFPTENELWSRYMEGKGIDQRQEKIITEPDYYDTFKKIKPRYYQRTAINRTVEAVARGQKRILLVMATGTGKTFTAFQIVWKLIRSKTVRRVLYLADRNILIDQTMQQDFKPFEKVMTKVENRKLDSSYEVYMSLYQQLAGDENKEPFRELKPEFFDLIIIDEAHRGSAKEDSEWRKILDYFKSAIHIGMTATPKETDKVSNIDYFGEPVYTYSLKQGIDDGYLAPYKVIRIGLDKDLEGWRPYKGQKDIYGNTIDDEEYTLKNFDKKLIIDERTQAVANRISKWLKANDRFAKTIVFCVDIDHAERMRQALINENQDLMRENAKYIMRITGDNEYGKAHLDNFTDVNEKYPSIVTTSKLLTTGVNVKTCKLIVLDNNINSMTEFKQIIGRGTRLSPENGKEYFTIIDFRNSCRLFADPEFNGEPIVIRDAGDGGSSWDPSDMPNSSDPNVYEEAEIYEPDRGKFVIPEYDDEPVKKFRVRGVEVKILNERVQYYDKDGKLTTESIKDYTKKNILNEYSTLDSFINNWNEAERKKAVIEKLEENGVFLEALINESNKDMDPFDLVLDFAFNEKPLTRKERVSNVKKRGYLNDFSEPCRKVLSALLDKYGESGIEDLETTRILQNDPFNKLGSPRKIADMFGGKSGYINAVKNLEKEIYRFV